MNIRCPHCETEFTSLTGECVECPTCYTSLGHLASLEEIAAHLKITCNIPAEKLVDHKCPNCATEYTTRPNERVVCPSCLADYGYPITLRKLNQLLKETL